MRPELEQIVTELREADRQDRIELLLELARDLPALPPELEPLRDEAHRVQECQSPVFLFVTVEDGHLRLRADAPIEAPTVRGFVALLVEGLDGATLEEVRDIPADLVDRTGVTEILGMQRRSGLAGLVRRLRAEIGRAVAESTCTGSGTSGTSSGVSRAS